tara:strand:+ start:79 stop:504 length:426 start_codon:yes stop_codon:yes gene_type:complete
MLSTATINQFNIEFQYKKITNKLRTKYIIVDPFEFKPLEYEKTVKSKLENAIKNYINENIDKLPFDTDKLTNLIGFDYESIPDRLNSIKEITNIEINSMSMISKDDNYFLDIDLDVSYLNEYGNVNLLLPSKNNTYIELTI